MSVHPTAWALEGVSSAVVRVRPDLWPRDVVRDVVRRLWMGYHEHPKVVAARVGARDPGLSALERVMRPAAVAEIMSELTRAVLSQRYDEGPKATERAGAQSRRGATAAAVHRGLLCADTYNLHAAMWEMRAADPQAALFLQVCLGRLPPGILAELHKTASGLHRSLSAAAKSGAVSTEALHQLLLDALPGASAAQCDALVAIVEREAPPSGKPGALMRALEPSPKEPCLGDVPRAPMAALQRLFLIIALRLRDDVEGALRRAASDATAAPNNPAPGALAAAPPGGSEAAPVGAGALRCALLRVDAEMPEPFICDHIARVFGGGSGGSGGSGGARSGAAGGAADPDPPTLPLHEVCARLFSEPLRRYGPRTSPAVLQAATAALRALDKAGGKKGKAKKGKAGADAAAATVTLSALREAVTKADPGARPSVETECVVVNVFAAARQALAAARSAPASAGAPPPPPLPAAPDELPLEAVLEALQDSLLQPTSARQVPSATATAQPPA